MLFPVQRSQFLMGRTNTALLLIDVQEKLAPRIAGHERVIWNAGRLLDGASLLDIPVVCTEQYPEGLGPTVPELKRRIGQVDAKRMFSCRECETRMAALREGGRHNLLLCGIETHVCVLQTALDLLADGFNVFLAVDAVGARNPLDHEIALRRMEACGATLATTESALFEWCESSSAPEFKSISSLVRQSAPGPNT